jgi:hypothetical protein
MASHYLQSHGVKTVALEADFENASRRKKLGVNAAFCASNPETASRELLICSNWSVWALEHVAQPNDLVAEKCSTDETLGRSSRDGTIVRPPLERG